MDTQKQLKSMHYQDVTMDDIKSTTVMNWLDDYLNFIRDGILTNKYNTMIGENYERITITHPNNSTTIALPEEDISKISASEVTKETIKLPKTLKNVVDCIDKAKRGEITPVEALLAADKSLETSLKTKQMLLFATREDEYQLLKLRFNQAAKKLYVYFTQAIQNEINEIKTRQQQKLPGYHETADNELLYDLESLLELDTNPTMPSQKIDYLGQLNKLMSKISSIESDHRLKHERDLSKLKHSKLKHYFDTKILRYKDFLEKTKDINPYTLDVNADLTFIIKDMIHNYRSVSVEKNILDEILIRASNGRVYNLTQIIRAEPAIHAIKLDKADYDQYYDFLLNTAQVFTPSPKTFPSIASVGSLTATDCEDRLEEILKNNPTFKNCTYAEKLAINIYSTAAYSLMNIFLRNATVPDDLFVNLPNDKIFKDALLEMEVRLRQTNDPTKLLEDHERSQIVKEALMVNVMATLGLAHAKHLSFNPIADHSYSTEAARSLRGTSGPRTIKFNKLLAMASIGGTVMYSNSFVSSTFKPDEILTFMPNPDKLVTKATSIGLDSDKEGVGVDISALSQYPDEVECLYYPSCVMLVSPESPVKNPSNYPVNIDKKASIIYTAGYSPNSYFYSSEINGIRDKLIELFTKDLKPMMASALPSDKKVLEEIQSLLTTSIHQLKSQFKTFDVCISDGVPNMKDLQKLPPHVSGAYVLTKNNEIYYLDKDKQTITPLKISSADFQDILDKLDIQAEFNQFATGFKSVQSGLSLVELNYIKTMTKQPELETSYTAEESLSKLSRRLSYMSGNLISKLSLAQLSNESFSPKLVKLEKEVSSLKETYTKPKAEAMSESTPEIQPQKRR